jgi:bidirectional [NiFe] hydrogenase diaphorase subunit
MILEAKKPPLPSADKRWKLVEATVRRHGAQGHALIETLHTVQESFGYLDETGLRYVAKALHLPLSKVYGVATFYQFFTLKPQGEHTCVVCMGTACYIKGAPTLLESIGEKYSVKPGQTTADNKMSLLVARCVGSCGIAPAVVFDGNVVGKVDRSEILNRIDHWMTSHDGRRTEQDSGN